MGELDSYDILITGLNLYLTIPKSHSTFVHLGMPLDGRAPQRITLLM
jgi:hypothetical protein